MSTNNAKKVQVSGRFLQGLSAYEVAVKNGFEGSEEEWLISLIRGVYVGSGVAPEGTVLQVDNKAAGDTLTVPDVLQTTGNSEEDTMSQKAITEALSSSSAASSEVWETLYYTGDDGVTVDLITSFVQTLNKTQDRYKEYRMTLGFSKDTSDETTGNKTVNIYIDGCEVSYYKFSIQEGYIENIFVHVVPAAPCINHANKNVLDTFCFVFDSEPAGHYTDRCQLSKFPEQTDGKLKIYVLSPFSGTIWCRLQGKK